MDFQCVDGWGNEINENEDGEMGAGLSEERKEWRLPEFLLADDFLLYGGLEKNLIGMIRHFAEVCKRRRSER